MLFRYLHAIVTITAMVHMAALVLTGLMVFATAGAAGQRGGRLLAIGESRHAMTRAMQNSSGSSHNASSELLSITNETRLGSVREIHRSVKLMPPAQDRPHSGGENVTPAMKLVSETRQIPQYELPVEQPQQLSNKVALAIVEILGLGLFGVDRCVMGQACLGVIKGLTLGGVFVWALLDWCFVIVNALSGASTLQSLGYNVVFSPGTVMPALLVTMVIMVTMAMSTCFCAPFRHSKLDDLINEIKPQRWEWYKGGNQASESQRESA